MARVALSIIFISTQPAAAYSPAALLRAVRTPQPLATFQRATPAVLSAAAPPPADEPQQKILPSWRRALRRPWRKLATAVTLAGASLMLQQKPALAVAPTPKQTASALKKKPSTQSVNGGPVVMVLAGGFAYYSYASAAKEDEEETVRIKKETEKMERMQKEFTDIDGDVRATPHTPLATRPHATRGHERSISRAAPASRRAPRLHRAAARHLSFDAPTRESVHAAQVTQSRNFSEWLKCVQRSSARQRCAHCCGRMICPVARLSC